MLESNDKEQALRLPLDSVPEFPLHAVPPEAFADLIEHARRHWPRLDLSDQTFTASYRVGVYSLYMRELSHPCLLQLPYCIQGRPGNRENAELVLRLERSRAHWHRMFMESSAEFRRRHPKPPLLPVSLPRGRA